MKYNWEKNVKKYWRAFIALAVTFVAVILPVHGIGIAEEYISSYNLFLAVHIVFFVDIIANLYFSVYCPDNQFLIKNHLAEYLRGWFFIDLLAAIPFVLFANSAAFQFVIFLKLLRLFNYFYIWYIKSVKYSTYLRIAFFIYGLIIASHWITCGWIALGGVDVAAGFKSAYIRSLYWCVTTLTTVGYGDVIPVTDSQRLFSIGVMCFGIGMYGYLIGNIASILSKRNPARARYQENLDRLSALVSVRNIPLEMQNKIRDYHSYVYTKRSGLDETTLLAGLPQELKQEVSLYLKSDLVEKVPLFRNAPQKFIRDISYQMRPLLLAPDSYVVRAGETGSEMFFVAQGELEVLSQDNNAVLSKLRSGDFFGEIALFEDIPRTANIKTITYCDLYVLDKKTFDSVIRRYPDISNQIEKESNLRHAYHFKNDRTDH